MKKQIIGLLAFAAATSAAAFDNPSIVPDLQIHGFSPDKKACAGAIMNTAFIFDMNDLTHPKIFSESEDGLVGYSLGHGNFMSNSSALINRKEFGPSAWCWSPEGSILNGRWRTVEAEFPLTGLSSANAVTPDGSRVCGNISGDSQFGEDNVTYAVPRIWEFDGTTFTHLDFKYPTTDYAGLAPQYITALAMSDNGNTIIGQIVSNNGFLCEYVVYKQEENGTWTYFKPFDDKVNPNKLVLPEYPGEGPAVPMAESYLTPSEKEAFDKAMQEYENGQGEEPDAEDYLKDPDARAAYLAAIEKYNEWGKRFEAYDNVDKQIIMQSISFCFNMGAISPNGRYFCASAVKTFSNPDGSTYDVFEPVLYDLEDMKQVKIPIEAPDQPGYALSVRVTGVSDNGDVIGYERMSDIDFGYVLKAGASQWMPLENYIIERQPSMASWIEKNWRHTVEVLVDPEEEIYEYQDMIITGLPMVSRDFSIVSTCAYTFWSDGPEELRNRYISYVLDLDREASSINEVSAGNGAITGDWYNLQGIKIAEPSHCGIYLRGGKKVLVK